jgi:hypothetical protein
VIDKHHAVRLIEDLLRDRERRYAEEGHAMPLGITEVTEHRFGWVLHWQSQAFIHSGNRHDMLIGTGPYLVDRHVGSIHFIPGTDYMSGLWEEDYEQHIRPPHNATPDPWNDVPFAAELRKTLDGEGRIAAIRLLRQHAPALTMAQANQYVAAVAVGQHPPAQLLDLARAPEPFSPRLGVRTITGPNLDSADSFETSQPPDSTAIAK